MPKLTIEEKKAKLVDSWTDAMELDALISFFKEKQEEYLDTLSQSEIEELYNKDIGE